MNDFPVFLLNDKTEWMVDKLLSFSLQELVGGFEKACDHSWKPVWGNIQGATQYFQLISFVHYRFKSPRNIAVYSHSGVQPGHPGKASAFIKSMVTDFVSFNFQLYGDGLNHSICHNGDATFIGPFLYTGQVNPHPQCLYTVLKHPHLFRKWYPLPAYAPFIETGHLLRRNGRPIITCKV